jgi:formylglycine-generating enzyme required for sulfatase activity
VWRSLPLYLCIFLATLPSIGCQGSSNVPVATVQPPAIVATRSGIEMVIIPAGSFEMGSKSGREEEKPVHKVWIDSFLMDRHEMTQAVWDKIGKEKALPNPSHFKGDDLPVEQVTWPMAARFCNARSAFEGLQPCYNEDTGECDFNATGYRLPTEAEWEYACRAGTSTDYSYGDESRKLGEVAWFADNAAKKTHPVKQKKANPWGLFDMHGNVAEWCQDCFDKNYYKASAEKNPCRLAGEDDEVYVLRGGSWKSPAEALHSSRRIGEKGGFSDACLARDAIGFRCVRKPPAEPAPNK